MTRPTTLKLHDFPEDSFIHGCYILDLICDDLIKYFDENPDRHESGITYCADSNTHGIKNTEKNVNVKESTEISFCTNQNEEDAKILSEYIRSLNLCIQEYEYKYERAKTLVTYASTETINIQKYEPSEGYKVWHCERYGISQQTRCFAFMTYLNDVPDGGTEFMYQKLISPAKKGLTMIWPSDWTHTHKGQISSTHKKFIITGWLNYTA